MKLLKEIYYKYITTPISRLIDLFNYDKRELLTKRHYLLSKKQQLDYITDIARELSLIDIDKYRDDLTPAYVRYIIDKNIMKAETKFREHKRKGDFDELNNFLK